MPQLGLLPALRGVSDWLVVVVLVLAGCFEPGVDVSIIFATFLDASLFTHGETQVLGGET